MCVSSVVPVLYLCLPQHAQEIENRLIDFLTINKFGNSYLARPIVYRRRSTSPCSLSIRGVFHPPIASHDEFGLAVEMKET